MWVSKKKYQETVLEYESRISKLDADLARVKSESARAYANLANEYQKLRVQNSDQAKEIQALTERAARYEHELTARNRELADEKAKVAAREVEISKLESAMRDGEDKALAAFEALNREIDRLRDENARLKNENDALETERDNLLVEIDRLTALNSTRIRVGWIPAPDPAQATARLRAVVGDVTVERDGEGYYIYANRPLTEAQKNRVKTELAELIRWQE